MKTKKYKFTMSYHSLFNQCIEKKSFLYEDLSVLTDRGVTAARLAAFDGLIATFVNTPQNETSRAKITIDKEQRNQYMLQLRAAYKELWGIAKTTFGEKTAEYRIFNSTSVSQLNAKKLYDLSFAVLPAAEKYFTQLQVYGFTVAMYNNIKNLTDAMAAASNNTYQTKVARLSTTQQRQDAANNLYIELKKMCDIAYTYFENRNKLRAGMYLIYNTKGKYQQRNGTIAAQTTTTIKFKQLSANHKFKLMVTTGNSLEFYFSKTVGGEPYGKTLVVPVNDSQVLECIATRLGYNSNKGATHFCIKNTGENSVDSRFRVKVVG